jgi:hypothetical protein
MTTINNNECAHVQYVSTRELFARANVLGGAPRSLCCEGTPSLRLLGQPESFYGQLRRFLMKLVST